MNRTDPVGPKASSPPGPASSLPASCYVSTEMFAAELRHIHLRHWFFVGREEEFPAQGDYRAIETVGGPAIVLRDLSGTLRGFANVCRHRGGLLLEGSGNSQVITCPYHAWSYRLDGSLRGAPWMEQLDDAARARLGLAPIRLESWAGFVFMTFDANAPSLRLHLGDLPELFASHRLDQMVCTFRTSFHAGCNWKLILENAMETYHTGWVHAATVGAQSSVSLDTRGAWQAIQVLSETSIAVLGDAPPPLPPIEGLTKAARQGTYFTCIHPTTQFAVAQDCLWWLAVRPLAADRSVLELGGCFPRSTVALPDFPRHAEAYYDRWRRVAIEDLQILERQQRALGSVLHQPGPLSWRDDQVHLFGQWVLRQIPPDQRKMV